MDTILRTIKKLLGIEEAYEHFDTDLVMHINSVFISLNQLGIGPQGGFLILGKEEKWTDFLAGDANLEAVKTYIYLKVRLLFDPPATSFVLESIERQIKELEWRLNIQADQPITTVPTEVIT